MKKDNLEYIDVIFRSGLYTCDLVSGNIYSSTGNIKSSYQGKGSRVYRIGLTMPGEYTVRRNGAKKPKTKCYVLATIVAYLGGLFDGIEDPSKYVVINKNGKYEDTSLNNLQVITRKEFAKQKYDAGILYEVRQHRGGRKNEI